jgi:membrane associated rhomboid family serine protease
MIPLSGAMLIFATTIAISLIALFAAPKLLDQSLFRPYWFLRRQEYSTVIMSGFVHADLAHLLFNMITFYAFGFALERVIGTGSFVALYVIGLLVSHAGTYYKQRSNPEYACLGASGAISAVLFAAIVYFPTQSLYILPLPVPIPAPLFAIGYLAYTYWASRNPHGRINHDAHLGGAISGLVFVALTNPSAYVRLLRWFG